ncbi:MAG: PDDEXK nuclease domain-containing protein [Bacteroidales bacterium]|jgi:predicted nuclease of restriction endonuclease-like (RecB) superfamily|nr:PDDEXK nuclease domain-containing protein [Bacteroidales bacterium]
MEQHISPNFSDAIQTIKNAILQSRYRVAALANQELLSLYYGIGKYISENSRSHFWGTNAIETISERLQQEMPGLRGFSASNIKNMRMFYEEWNQLYPIRQSVTGEIAILPQNIDIQPLTSNRQSTTGDLQQPNSEYGHKVSAPLEHFFKTGFTHHCEILTKVKNIEARLFYIERCATEFWSVEKLKYNIKSDLYGKQGQLPNNFQTTISDKDFQRKAMLSFKDEYLLDYINIESPDDEPDERVLENEIVNNIRKFIMSLGKDFSFIGNQYRLIVEEQEYFIDLLFYNRQLQCLVAIELKRGDFKPEYLGKMNFYLSALDEYIRLPHENRSIGIILCKSQRKSVVEFAFRDMSKPMGVATYKTNEELPEEYKNILPNPEKLVELL